MLEGIRILDFSRSLAGPICSRILSGLGAEVIRVDSKEGDLFYRYPPIASGFSWFFIHSNVGKKSISVDLKKEKGRELVKKLVRKSDVVLENFRPGVMEKLTLSYEDLKKEKNDIIMCSISGVGPKDKRPFFATIIHALTSITSSTERCTPDKNPYGVPFNISDTITGLFSAIAILSCIHNRQITGMGQYIDMSMFDCSLFVCDTTIPSYLTSGKLSSRVMLADKPIKVKDGYVNTLPYFVFKNIAKAINQPDLLKGERFNKENFSRNYEQIFGIIQDWGKDLTREEFCKIFSEHDIPCAPVKGTEEVVSSELVKERNMILNLDVDGETIKVINNPFKFSNYDASPKRRPPRIGEHTYEILTNLGLSNEEIKELKENEIVFIKEKE